MEFYLSALHEAAMLPFACVATLPSAPPTSASVRAGVGLPLRQQPTPSDKVVATPLLTALCCGFLVADGTASLTVCAAVARRAQMALGIGEVSHTGPKRSFALTCAACLQAAFYNEA